MQDCLGCCCRFASLRFLSVGCNLERSKIRPVKTWALFPTVELIQSFSFYCVCILNWRLQWLCSALSSVDTILHSSREWPPFLCESFARSWSLDCSLQCKYYEIFIFSYFLSKLCCSKALCSSQAFLQLFPVVLDWRVAPGDSCIQKSCRLPLLQGAAIPHALWKSRWACSHHSNPPWVWGAQSPGRRSSRAAQANKKLQNGILTGSWIALVIESSPHRFYSTKSMNICQIKLIANVWLFSSASVPCCRFVSGEAVCSIDWNLKNDCVHVASFSFSPFFLPSSLY